MRFKMSDLLNETISTIHNRKTVRDFTKQAVPQELLNVLIKAAMAAPTAVNSQPWEFIVVTEKSKLEKLAHSLQFSRMLDSATAAIIVCTDPNKSKDKDVNYAIIDATLASENILLAAESLGLGGAWVAVFPKDSVIEYIRNEFDIPDNIIPLNIIPLGFPVGNEKPKNKYNPGVVHFEKWNNK
jgi:nitroreductase